MTREDRPHAGTLAEIRDALEAGGGVAAVVGLLHDRLPHYSWVGFYRLEGEELVLGPWRGPQATDHVRIPVGEGVCGAAAASRSIEVVDDVRSDPRYLACFPSTRSEIVVPVARRGRVVGELDVDSDRPAAFDARDRALLQAVARLLAVPPRTWLVDEWGRGSFPASDAPCAWAGRDVPAAA